MEYRYVVTDGFCTEWKDSFTPDVQDDCCFHILATGQPYEWFEYSRGKLSKKDYDWAAGWRKDFILNFPQFKNLSEDELRHLDKEDRDDVLEWFVGEWFAPEDPVPSYW